MSQACEKNLGLLGETFGCMVLDSGTTATVGGLTWYNCFLDTLSDDVHKKSKFKKERIICLP